MKKINLQNFENKIKEALLNRHLKYIRQCIPFISRLQQSYNFIVVMEIILSSQYIEAIDLFHKLIPVYIERFPPLSRHKAIDKVLSSKSIKAIRTILPYLKSYIINEESGQIRLESLYRILRCRSPEAIQISVPYLERCMKEAKEDTLITLIEKVLSSHTSKAIVIIIPYLESYIKDANGEIQPKAISKTLICRCAKAQKIIIPYLDEYVKKEPFALKKIAASELPKDIKIKYTPKDEVEILRGQDTTLSAPIPENNISIQTQIQEALITHNFQFVRYYLSSIRDWKPTSQSIEIIETILSSSYSILTKNIIGLLPKYIESFSSPTDRHTAINKVLNSNFSKAIFAIFPYLKNYLKEITEEKRLKAIDKILICSGSKTVEIIFPYLKTYLIKIPEESRLETIKKILSSRHTKGTIMILPYLEDYFKNSNKHGKRLEMIEKVLKSQNSKAINIILPYLKDYIKEANKYTIIENILISQNNKIIKKILPYLKNYIKESHKYCQWMAFDKILSSRCRSAIKILIPYLDDYIKAQPSMLKKIMASPLIPKKIKKKYQSEQNLKIINDFTLTTTTDLLKPSQFPTTPVIEKSGITKEIEKTHGSLAPISNTSMGANSATNFELVQTINIFRNPLNAFCPPIPDKTTYFLNPLPSTSSPPQQSLKLLTIYHPSTEYSTASFLTHDASTPLPKTPHDLSTQWVNSTSNLENLHTFIQQPFKSNMNENDTSTIYNHDEVEPDSQNLNQHDEISIEYTSKRNLENNSIENSFLEKNQNPITTEDQPKSATPLPPITIFSKFKKSNFQDYYKNKLQLK